MVPLGRNNAGHNRYGYRPPDPLRSSAHRARPQSSGRIAGRSRQKVSRYANGGKKQPATGYPPYVRYKAAVWLAGFHRQTERLDQMKSRILMGEFGGAVGTLASLGEKGLAVQQGMLEELGLLQPPIAWHTVRDTIAEAGCFLGILCGLLDKVATDVKVMMMTELDEVQE